jgi:Rod binding domain-containing protein
MPVALQGHGSLELAPKDAGQQRQAAAAARQFEGVLLQQVLKVLWNTTKGIAGPQGDMYRQMFEGQFADHLAQGGGIGLAPMLEQALGGRSSGTTLGTVHRSALSATALPIDVATPTAGEPLTGETASLQAAAKDLLRNGGDRWSKDGTLLPSDLQSSFATDAAGGQARFSVRDARGYQGYYKCNLFAFELARRAGFEVPLSARDRGWGFPSAGQVTDDASDGKVERGWAKVATGESAATLDASIRDGSRALMLTGSGEGEHHGHMAIVERLHSVEYAPTGEISRIVFDGWEARPEGASRLQQRTWNLTGHGGGNLPRDGFQHMEILELKRPDQGAQNEVPLAGTAPASRLDESGSSEVGGHPISGLEDQS